MASRGKKKTTFAKLARETKLRERHLAKQVRKDARKRSAQLEATEPIDTPESPESVIPVEGAA